MMKKIVLITIILLSMSDGVHAQGAARYLIFEDIGDYKLSPGFELMGKLVGREPVAIQEGDEASGYYKACAIKYSENVISPPLSVEVRIYQNSQWLQHQLEERYRDAENMHATLDANIQIRIINGNNLFFYGVGGENTYTWISGKNTVVDIFFPGYSSMKPEPLDVVKAYLAKYPSTIILKDAELKSKAHNDAWIKSEMEHRLWLGNRWMGQVQLGRADGQEALMDIVEHMMFFLDYREKFFGSRELTEKELLLSYRKQENGATLIKNKLAEYGNWLEEHKDAELRYNAAVPAGNKSPGK